MAKITEPDEIYVEFLRVQLTEPTRDNYSARHTNTTETFTGDGTASDFTVANTKLLCVNNVSVDSVLQAKYSTYDIDLVNNKITFNSSNLPSNGAEVLVDHDFNTAGRSWVYPDKPRLDLGRSSMPRIGVVLITEDGQPTGMSDDAHWNNLRFQVDVLTQKDLSVTSNSETLIGQSLVNGIARDVVRLTKNSWRNNMGTKLYQPQIFNNSPQPYDETNNVFKRTIEVGFNAEDTGE